MQRKLPQELLCGVRICDTAEKIKELAGKDNFEQAFVAIVKGGVQ